MTQSPVPGAPHDVGDADFDALVLERSKAVPVLVDFWAPWCGPCRMLGPVIEKVAAELAGKVELVKVNTDDNQGVAGRYRITGIPAVKLFVDGAVAAEFTGALPEPAVRAFLDEHLPSGAARQARAAAEEAFYAGDLDRAIALARAVPARSADWDRMQALATLAEAAGAPVPDGDALAATYAAALARLQARDPRGALDGLLEVVDRDRRWRDEAGRRTMLAIFQLLGVRSPLSDEYRRKLALLL